MSVLRHFALPLFGLALWFAVAVAVLSAFAPPTPAADEPSVTLIAPEVVVTGCCDCADCS